MFKAYRQAKSMMRAILVSMMGISFGLASSNQQTYVTEASPDYLLTAGMLVKQLEKLNHKSFDLIIVSNGFGKNERQFIQNLIKREDVHVIFYEQKELFGKLEEDGLAPVVQTLHNSFHNSPDMGCLNPQETTQIEVLRVFYPLLFSERRHFMHIDADILMQKSIDELYTQCLETNQGVVAPHILCALEAARTEFSDDLVIFDVELNPQFNNPGHDQFQLLSGGLYFINQEKCASLLRGLRDFMGQSKELNRYKTNLNKFWPNYPLEKQTIYNINKWFLLFNFKEPFLYPNIDFFLMPYRIYGQPGLMPVENHERVLSILSFLETTPEKKWIYGINTSYNLYPTYFSQSNIIAGVQSCASPIPNSPEAIRQFMLVAALQMPWEYRTVGMLANIQKHPILLENISVLPKLLDILPRVLEHAPNDIVSVLLNVLQNVRPDLTPDTVNFHPDRQDKAWIKNHRDEYGQAWLSVFEGWYKELSFQDREYIKRLILSGRYDQKIQSYVMEYPRFWSKGFSSLLRALNSQDREAIKKIIADGKGDPRMKYFLRDLD